MGEINSKILVLIWYSLYSTMGIWSCLIADIPIRSASGPENLTIVITPNMGLCEWQALKIEGVVWRESV